MRWLTRVDGRLDRLSQQISDYPRWQDVARLEANLIARIAAVEADVDKIEDEVTADAKTARNRFAAALATGGVSLIVTLLAWLLTGR